MAKFLMQPTINQRAALTTRLGAGTGAANQVDQKEVGKLVKLVGDSQYDLCAVGDKIEGSIVAVEPATQDNYSIGSVQPTGRLDVTFDGSEAAGTGAIAVGDYVVAGTPVVKGTALGATVPAKVRKATNQPFAAVVLADNVVGTINAGLVKVADAMKVAEFAWRVVSLGSVGTGAVGTVGVIERVNLS